MVCQASPNNAPGNDRNPGANLDAEAIIELTQIIALLLHTPPQRLRILPGPRLREGSATSSRG